MKGNNIRTSKVVIAPSAPCVHTFRCSPWALEIVAELTGNKPGAAMPRCRCEQMVLPGNAATLVWERAADELEEHVGLQGWTRKLYQDGGRGVWSSVLRGPATAAKVAVGDHGHSAWADLMLEFVFNKHGSAAVARLLREAKAPEDIADLAMNQPDSQDLRERFDAASRPVRAR